MDDDTGKLMARAGETLCCGNGHPNYRFRELVRAGDLVRSTNLEAVNGMPDPIPFGLMARCCICGEGQVRAGPTGIRQINVDGQWRGDGVFLSDSTN